jgi:uncharacterized membrane protein YhdT
MAAEAEILCPMCGGMNPPDAERCRSCGAKVEPLTASYSSDEEQARRYQQDHFELRWALRATAVYLVLQTIILVILPFVISTFDPQGLPGLLISVVVWFFGGIVVGFVSPGKTFVEPAVGALIAVIPTVAYIGLSTPDGFQPSLLAYVVTAMLGVMISLFGAFLGEKLQMGSRDRTAKA